MSRGGIKSSSSVELERQKNASERLSIAHVLGKTGLLFHFGPRESRLVDEEDQHANEALTCSSQDAPKRKAPRRTEMHIATGPAAKEM